MHPRHFAQSQPDAPALTMLGSGESLTYGELELRANREARALRAAGLRPGDVVAVFKTNTLGFLPLYWGTQRSGVVFCPIAKHLTVEEVLYIVENSGAKLFITDGGVTHAEAVVGEMRGRGWEGRMLASDIPVAGLPSWNHMVDGESDAPLADEEAGNLMLYSSGTTGHPKGIAVKRTTADVLAPSVVSQVIEATYGAGPHTTYLSPAPLYHAAPLGYCTNLQRLGAHIIVMERFDPEAWLRAVEDYSVQMSQVVPTMFVRMLQLPQEVRERYDTSSLQCVLHAAAPCPEDIKRRMLDWLGPVVVEYYGGSEGNGMTSITAKEWLKHPGSVGKPSWGEVHVCDAQGDALPAGEEGIVYFKGGNTFAYLGDPEKTASAHNPKDPTMSTLGDIGYMNVEGYLFLTDRLSHTIISGGVNVYPQEIENRLVEHEAVADAAVIGVPDPDFGERVAAYVQLVDPSRAGEDLRGELLDYLAGRISKVKLPKSLQFVDSLPRTDTGKLIKRRLKESVAAGTLEVLA